VSLYCIFENARKNVSNRKCKETIAFPSIEIDIIPARSDAGGCGQGINLFFISSDSEPGFKKAQKEKEEVPCGKS
jgi:hypothetical protein